MKKKVILVLGMHRSGTSVLSAGLEALGVDFGNNLLPEQEDNPKGYWEDERIVELNNSMLDDGGVSSGDVGFAVTHFPTDRIQNHIDAAVELLAQCIEGKSVLGIKDPRMPRLMPIWQKAFERLDLDVDYVVTVRHPMSVADSLKQRDQLNRTKSFMLWYEHTFRALEASLGHRPVVVEYERFLTSPKEELMRISHRLSLPLNEETYGHFIRDILDVSLCHSQHRYNALVSSPESFPSLLRLYDLTKHLARDEPPELDPSKEQWQSTYQDFQTVWPFLVSCGDLDRRFWQFSESYRENSKYIKDLLNHDAGDKEDPNTAAQSKKLLDQAMRMSVLVDTINKERKAHQADQLLHEQRIQDSARHIEFLKHEQGLYQESVDRLKEHIENLEQQIVHLKEYIEHLKDQLNQLVSSHSWRITAPVRWVVNHLPISRRK